MGLTNSLELNIGSGEIVGVPIGESLGFSELKCIEIIWESKPRVVGDNLESNDKINYIKIYIF